MWPRKREWGSLTARSRDTGEARRGAGLHTVVRPDADPKGNTKQGARNPDSSWRENRGQTCRTEGLSWTDESWMPERKGEATGCPRLRTGSTLLEEENKRKKEDTPKRQKSRRCRDPKGRKCVLMGPLKSCRRQDNRDNLCIWWLDQGWRGGAEARLPVRKQGEHECWGPVGRGCALSWPPSPSQFLGFCGLCCFPGGLTPGSLPLHTLPTSWAQEHKKAQGLPL